MTQCNRNRLHFQGHGRREVVAQFDGGMITSDAGGLLLREVNEAFGVIRKFASCFRDHRDGELIEHPVEQLLAQRVMGIALGYEDLNDHDELRHDPLMALLCGRDDLTGRKRAGERHRFGVWKEERDEAGQADQNEHPETVMDHAIRPRLFRRTRQGYRQREPLATVGAAHASTAPPSSTPVS